VPCLRRQGDAEGCVRGADGDEPGWREGGGTVDQASVLPLNWLAVVGVLMKRRDATHSRREFRRLDRLIWDVVELASAVREAEENAG